MKKYIGQIIGCIIGICLFGYLSYIVAATFNTPASIQVETMNVETMNFSSEGSEPITGEFVGGLTGTTHFTYNVDIGEDLEVGDEFTYGDVTEDWIEGTCTNGTTTIMSVINPFSAAVTVDYFYIDIVNGTSTVTYTIGTSTTAGSLSADPSDTLIDDVQMATSTDGTATTTERIYLVSTSGAVTTDSGFTDPGTNSSDNIRWESGEYIKGFAETLYPGALTEATNFASCTYRIHTFR